MFKLTKLEKSWVKYDVGNSAFIMLITAIIPIYFNFLAEQGGLTSIEYLAYWSFASSIATILVILFGPILGAISDRKDMKKRIFLATVLLGVLSGIIMGFMPSWLSFIILFIVAKTSCQLSFIFSDAMLPEITSNERVDIVSSYGYAYGYVGSCIPFIIGLGLILFGSNIGIGMVQAIQIAIILHMLWWLLFSFPIIKDYKQTAYIENRGNPFTHGFIEIGDTLKKVVKDKKMLLFLLAFFFYIDGVYTVISLSTAYGSALGLDSNQLIIALLVTQLIAFPAAIILGRITSKINPETILTICIVAYLGIAIYAIGLDTTTEFWVLAVSVGLFQGTIQALSRSYFAKIIPAEDSGKYFSFMDICGKGASFLGTFTIGIVTMLTGQEHLGVAVLSLFFVIGLVLFRIMIRVAKN